MNLFTYGTLMDAAIMHKVCAEQFPSRAAVISGYVRKKLIDEVYPGIIEQPDASVQGRVYFNVSTQALQYLDDFEGDYYQRKAVIALLDDGEAVQAETYVMTAASASLLSQEDWSLEEFLHRDKPLFEEKYGGYDR